MSEENIFVMEPTFPVLLNTNTSKESLDEDNDDKNLDMKEFFKQRRTEELQRSTHSLKGSDSDADEVWKNIAEDENSSDEENSAVSSTLSNSADIIRGDEVPTAKTDSFLKGVNALSDIKNDEHIASVSMLDSTRSHSSDSLYELDEHTKLNTMKKLRSLDVLTLRKNEDHFHRAISKFNLKPSVGIQYLTEKGMIKGTPEEVAKFLLEPSLSKTLVGDYLGEGNEFNIKVLKAYCHLLDFIGLTVDEALRKFLVGFRLPGEAQKIDRMMEAFATQFYQNNPVNFANSDVVYVLAFSLIMLNTDAHNPSVKVKMTKAGFIKNSTGINEQDVPEQYLSDIYDRIVKQEIKMAEDVSLTFVNAEKKGYLIKQGGRIKTWRLRWFLLSGACLYYFKKPEDKQVHGIIPLENLQVQTAYDLTKKKYSFRLVNAIDGRLKTAKLGKQGVLVEGNHEGFCLCAQNKDDFEEWVSAIQCNISRTPYAELLQRKKRIIMGGSSNSLATSPSKMASVRQKKAPHLTVLPGIE
jgi:cytohesin